MLHPLIYQQTKQQINRLNSVVKKPTKYILLVVPLLFETNFHMLCDKILVIDCEPEVQIERLIQRDSISKVLANKIIKSQLSNKTRLRQADYIINNNQSIALKSQVVDMNQLLTQTAKPITF
jgi:dephospho-CoA kinase